jgi:hypothetical protein
VGVLGSFYQEKRIMSGIIGAQTAQLALASGYDNKQVYVNYELLRPIIWRYSPLSAAIVSKCEIRLSNAPFLKSSRRGISNALASWWIRQKGTFHEFYL